jgi:DNA primase
VFEASPPIALRGFAVTSSFRPATTAGDDVKERVRDATDIVDLVGSYISLRRAGKGFVGLCPWHEDSRPSL